MGKVIGLIQLVIFIAVIVGMWKVFTKAGEPGFAAIVPIWNYLVLLKIAGKPTWWILLLLVPGVNFIIGILVTLNVAKAFGKSPIWFLIWPFIGFTDATYQGAPAS